MEIKVSYIETKNAPNHPPLYNMTKWEESVYPIITIKFFASSRDYSQNCQIK
ncbi:MAG TPA: hypothetical protein VIR31_00170 [Nitrososphaeraceae archaeon]